MKGLRLLFYLQANKLACHTFIYVYHDICFYINIYQSNRPIYIYVTICIYIHIKKWDFCVRDKDHWLLSAKAVWRLDNIALRAMQWGLNEGYAYNGEHY